MAEQSRLGGQITEAERELAGEHEELRLLADELGRAAGTPEVMGLLARLHDKLRAHFASEEHPGGLYDRMGVCGPRFRELVAGLVDEHYRIMGFLRVLQRKGSVTATAPDRTAEVSQLLDWLRQHERREHELAEAVARAQQN